MSRSRSSARTELADYGLSSSPSGGSDSPGVAAEHAVPRQRSPLRSRSARAVVVQADRLARQEGVQVAAREMIDLYVRLGGRKRGPRNALDTDVIGEPSLRLTEAQEDGLMDLTYNILCGF